MNTCPSFGTLALRISVTDRCQLRCRYCMPEEKAGGRRDGGRGKKILSYEEIVALVSHMNSLFGIDKIRLTGGEPLTRPGIERLVGMLSALGVGDVAMTTNGLALASCATALKQAGLSRVNVSLDALTPEKFFAITGGGDVRAALAGIDAARKAGLAPIKLNAVVVGGINNAEAVPLLADALERNCELRFIELMPIGAGADIFANRFVSSATVRRKLEEQYTLTPLRREPASSARRYAVTAPDGTRGTVGFISSCSMPFCAGCRRLRLTADGRLIGCLARDGGISIREMLRSGDMRAMGAAVFTALEGKRHDANFTQNMAMASVGG